ncbi:MAG: cell division protein ZapB [Desulfatiglandaceae bacterium]
MDTEETRQYKVWGSSETGEEVDQFQVLEEKVDHLIEMIKTLRNERDSYKERFEIQEEKISDLNKQVEALKGGKDRAKQRIVSLLEKLETIED